MFIDMFFPPHIPPVWMHNKGVIVSSYPIDGDVGAVMNSIQRRYEWSGFPQLPRQFGPIQHISIVLYTMENMYVTGLMV